MTFLKWTHDGYVVYPSLRLYVSFPKIPNGLTLNLEYDLCREMCLVKLLVFLCTSHLHKAEIQLSMPPPPQRTP